jgi:hypothetical protein
MRAAGVATFFFDIVEATELRQGATARFLGIHPCSDIVRSLLLDVEAKLSLELRVELSSVK